MYVHCAQFVWRGLTRSPHTAYCIKTLWILRNFRTEKYDVYIGENTRQYFRQRKKSSLPSQSINCIHRQIHILQLILKTFQGQRTDELLYDSKLTNVCSFKTKQLNKSHIIYPLQQTHLSS
jgi:hypothetical protein